VEEAVKAGVLLSWKTSEAETEEAEEEEAAAAEGRAEGFTGLSPTSPGRVCHYVPIFI
jgi:hypothetical protein